MSIQLDPNDTNYLSPRLETDNLIDNGLTLIPGPNLSLPPDAGDIPKVVSPGNNLNHIFGVLNVDSPLVATDVIAFLPATKESLNDGNYLMMEGQNPIFVTIVGNEIIAQSAIPAAGNFVSFGGLSYLGSRS
jgi:hypothetical protein